MDWPSTTFKHNGDLDYYMRDEKNAIVGAQDSSCQRKKHRYLKTTSGRIKEAGVVTSTTNIQTEWAEKALLPRRLDSHTKG